MLRGIVKWFKKHFTLGVLLSGAAGSILAWMIIEWKWPWFLEPIESRAVSSLTFLFSLTTALLQWLFGNTHISRFWYGFLLLDFGLSIVLCVVGAINYLIITSKENWYSYKTDVFFQLRWRWQFSKSRIVGLSASCPECERGLTVTDNYNGTYIYSCRVHGDIVNLDWDPSRLDIIARDEIRRNINTGEWKNRVANS